MEIDLVLNAANETSWALSHPDPSSFGGETALGE